MPAPLFRPADRPPPAAACALDPVSTNRVDLRTDNPSDTRPRTSCTNRSGNGQSLRGPELQTLEHARIRSQIEPSGCPTRSYEPTLRAVGGVPGGFLVDTGSLLDDRPLDSGPQEVLDRAKLTFRSPSWSNSSAYPLQRPEALPHGANANEAARSLRDTEDDENRRTGVVRRPAFSDQAPYSEESDLPDPTAADDHYPEDDAGRLWLFAQNIRKLVKQTLEPDQAERLLVKLERLFLEYGIYPPY